MTKFTQSFGNTVAGKPAASGSERIGRVLGSVAWAATYIGLYVWIGWWSLVIAALVTGACQIGAYAMQVRATS